MKNIIIIAIVLIMSGCKNDTVKPINGTRIHDSVNVADTTKVR